MTDVGTLGRDAWRLWNTDGAPSSGARRPPKSDILAFVGAVEAQKLTTLPNFAALRLYEGDATDVSLKARTSFGDKAGGPFAVKAGDTTTPDDGWMVAVDPLGRRWWRQFDRRISVRWPGAVGDGIANDVAAFTAAHAAAPAGAPIDVPAGTYLLNSDVTATGRVFLCDGCTFTGAGSLVGAVIVNTSDDAPVTATKLSYEMSESRGAASFVNEGSIWPGDVRVFKAISRTFTSADDNGGNSPNATLFAHAVSDGCDADIDAVLAVAYAKTNDAVAFASNFIARNEAGTTGTKLVAGEFDVLVVPGTSISNQSGGVFINLFNESAANIPALLISAHGGGMWGNGIVLSNITGAGICINTGDPGMTSGVDLQNGDFSVAGLILPAGINGGIHLGDLSADRPMIFGDGSSNGILQTGAGNYWVIKDAAGNNQILFDAFGAIDAKSYKIAGNQVMQARKAGWALPSGTLSRATFDESTVTLPQLAQRLAALITDAYSHHQFIGA